MTEETKFLDAVFNGHINEVKKFIEDGMDVNVEVTNRSSALNISIMKKHLNIFRYLLKKGARVNPSPFDGSYTPLMTSITFEVWEAFNILLKYKPDLSLRLKDDGWDALFFASRNHKDIRYLKTILLHGAKVDLSIQYKWEDHTKKPYMQEGNILDYCKETDRLDSYKTLLWWLNIEEGEI